MGLFSNNHDRPGKGVDKNGPQKRRIWEFFEIVWNQASKLILANILYSLAMLPLVIGIVLTFKIDWNSASIIVLKIPGQIDLLGAILLVVSIFTSFPATLGFCFILRNIQRREHAWIWSDFIKHTKRNYKSGVVNGFITIFVYMLLFFAFGAYRSGLIISGGIGQYMSLLILVGIILFTWMQYYISVMIVTFELKLSSVYRNALIFAIGKLPLNIFITAVCIVIIYLLLLFPIPFITFFLSFFLWYALFGSIIMFSVYPTIDRYMLQKAEKKYEE